VLLWTLKHVVGLDIYTSDVHQAWLKIYCRMVRIIIPVAVGLELRAGPSKVHNERSYSNSACPCAAGATSVSINTFKSRSVMACVTTTVTTTATTATNGKDAATVMPQVQEEDEEGHHHKQLDETNNNHADQDNQVTTRLAECTNTTHSMHVISHC